MPLISERTKLRVCEDVLGVLNERYPEPMTTRQVALELARDKEFVRERLEFLEKHGLVKRIGRPRGEYIKWRKWQLTDAARQKYAPY